MGVWNWMYQHPEATPAELREAALAIARDVWNRYFAPVFGVRDSDILAIYSHMIVYGLYLPDYAIGHILAFQIAQKLRAGGFRRRGRAHHPPGPAHPRRLDARRRGRAHLGPGAPGRRPGGDRV